jgi:hypothetical protein
LILRKQSCAAAVDDCHVSSSAVAAHELEVLTDLISSQRARIESELVENSDELPRVARLVEPPRTSSNDSGLEGEPLEIRLIAVEFTDADGYEVDFDEVLLTFSSRDKGPLFRRGDADDNGGVELTDAVRILGFLFQGTPPPPAPGPIDCREDPAEPVDALGCETYESCEAQSARIMKRTSEHTDPRQGRVVMVLERLRSLSLSIALLALIFLTTGASAQLLVDFNSTTQSGGPHHLAGYQAYDAGHEVTADFVTREYEVVFFGESFFVELTPEWPNTTDARVQQMIDRGDGNDANWHGDDVDLITDFLGIDARPGNGGNGDWDRSEFTTPTYMTLTLHGLPSGDYSWLSLHHDTEHCWADFQVEISTDGGVTYTKPVLHEATDSTEGGSPASLAVYQGDDDPDPRNLPSAFRAEFTADEDDDVVLRFAPFADGIDGTGVHKSIFAINGFELTELSERALTACFAAEDGDASREVAFDASCTVVPDGVTVNAYNWDLGDDNSASGEAVEHTYAAAGDYTVVLSIEASDGNRYDTSRLVRIRDTTLSITPQDRTLAVDGTLQLTVRLVGDFGLNEDVTLVTSGTVYTSDPAGAVDIDDDGLLYAEEAGETTVTATNGDLSDTMTVIVRDDLVLVENPGFEEPPLEDGVFNEADGPFWKLGFYDTFLDPELWVPGGADGGVWDPDAVDGFSGGAAFAGENVAWAVSKIGFDTGLSQILEANLEAETEYVLSVQVGNSFYNGSDQSAPHRIELLAGGVLLASDEADSPATDTWEAHSLTYNSIDDGDLVGEPLEIRLIAVEFTDAGGAAGYEVEFDEVLLTFTASDTGPTFRRGDADDNGATQLTDAVSILGFLFQGLPAPPCSDAADADNNGRVDLTDAVSVLGFLFQGTPPPPAPGPVDCGEDPAEPVDALGCDTYESCE